MNELIQKLYEMDQKASAILNDAQNRNVQLGKKLLLEQEQMDEQMFEQNEEQLKLQREKLDIQKQKETERLKQETDEKLLALHQSFHENKDSLVKEICQRIVGV